MNLEKFEKIRQKDWSIYSLAMGLINEISYHKKEIKELQDQLKRIQIEVNELLKEK